MSQQIKNLAQHIRNAEKISFIIGAGASVKAGIPLAGEIVNMVQQQFEHCIEGLSEKDREDYGKVMHALDPTERKSLIEPLLKDAKLNWGHVALARIVQQHSNVKRVLSFNFDFLLEKAFGLLGQHLPVYDFGVSPTRDIIGFAEPGLFHLHGQGFGLRLLNTEDETKTHAEKLERLLEDTLRNHITIIAGYSGVNDGAFEVMKRVYNNNCRLFWLGYDQEPPAHLNDLLAHDYAKYIGGCDFDLTMIDLARELDLWSLPIIDNPPAYVLSQLAGLDDFPVSAGADTTVLRGTRAHLRRSASQWEQDLQPEEIEARALVALRPLDESTDISEYTTEARRLRALRLFNQACDFEDTLIIKPAAKKKSILVKIYDSYSRAIGLNPYFYQAYYNWGGVLLDEARTLDGEARTAAFQGSYEKYSEATRIKPDYHQAFFNWGNALLSDAGTRHGKERSSLLQNACKKFTKVIEIKPDKHNALTNWGIALANEANTLTGAARHKTFADAYEKFAQAIEIKPDDHAALNNWGIALANEAHKLEGEERRQALNAALEKLNQAKATTGKASYILACAYTLLDDQQAALDELEACARDGTLPDAAHLQTDSAMNALRDEPRFQALLAGG